MRLTVVSPYGAGGASTRVRAYDWLHHLGLEAERWEYLGMASSGVRELFSRPGAVLAAERRVRGLVPHGGGGLLLQREASPLSRGGLEARLLRTAGRGVYDFDDALQWDHGRGSPARRLAPKAGKCVAAVKAADVVVAGNDLLADWACQWADDVVVVPSCVEPADYRTKSDYALSDPPRLGWLGSASAESHLAVAAAGLLQVHHRTGARLTVLSSGHRSLGPLDVMTDRVPWGPATFADEMRTWDVAVAPLQDTALARGKCAYKLVQYAAAGLPVVGSPVGVNRQVLAQLGGTAAGPGEWTEAVLALLGSDSLRERTGRHGPVAVAATHSFAAWADTWTRAVLGSGRAPR